jgi:hypothetical protein
MESKTVRSLTSYLNTLSGGALDDAPYVPQLNCWSALHRIMDDRKLTKNSMGMVIPGGSCAT